MAKRRIYIPTFIKDAEYNPSQVRPRLFFWNGLLDCESYFIEGYPTDAGSSIEQHEFSSFPYIDHYSTGSGDVPDQTSDTLLYFNESNPYGTTPSSSLYTEYWRDYISFLYNPTTRLIKVRAVLPIAEYFDTDLNDLIFFRGNYYQLRAINDYNVNTGECNLQLLGPVDSTVFKNETLKLTEDCYEYNYVNAADEATVSWITCNGFETSSFVSLGTNYTIDCARSGSVSADIGGGTITEVSLCGSYPIR